MSTEQFFEQVLSVRLTEDRRALDIIDQTLLPGTVKRIALRTREEIWDAIKRLQVRGAPAIGVCAASVGISVFTWEGFPTLLPMAAAVFSTSASWQTDTKKLKLLTIPVCVCWFIYNLFSRSYAGMANETFVFVSVLVALYRISRNEKQSAAPDC